VLGGRKRKNEKSTDTEVVTIKNREGEILCEETLTKEMFKYFSKTKDYAVIEFISRKLHSNQFYHGCDDASSCVWVPGHLNGQEMFTNGEITSINPHVFQLSFLSAPGLSGSAIAADDSGRAVGYLGGALDASHNSNSQHQSFAFKFDEIALTIRGGSPNASSNAHTSTVPLRARRRLSSKSS